jgi:spore maturation protein CgeB
MQSRWLIAVPPEGAARQAGIEAACAFDALIGKDRCKAFDCNKYLSFFLRFMKNPDQVMAVDLLNQALAVQCLDFGATHLLVNALSPVTLFTLNLLKKQGVKTAHWFYEDFRRAHYWKDVLAGYDSFFAIQKGPVQEECAKHHVAYSFLPTAVSSGILQDNPPPLLPRRSDVAFIGLPSSYRISVLEYLVQNCCTLTIAGSGWEGYRGPLEKSITAGTWIEGKQACQVLLSSKIGINLSLTPPAPDRENTHVSPRVFDVLASGCILLTENVPCAAVTMGGLHYYTFDKKEEAFNKIKAILADVEIEKSFCDSNRIKILQKHTYKNRVEEIISFCE